MRPHLASYGPQLRRKVDGGIWRSRLRGYVAEDELMTFMQNSLANEERLRVIIGLRKVLEMCLHVPKGQHGNVCRLVCDLDDKAFECPGLGRSSDQEVTYEAPYFAQVPCIIFAEPTSEVVGNTDVVRIYPEVLECDVYGEEGRGEEEAEQEGMRHVLRRLGRRGHAVGDV